MGKLVVAPLDLQEIAAPATPPSGTVRFYAKADGLLYSKDDAGVETVVTGGAGGGGGIAATIVDAKGDLIVGTAADTVARFAAGPDGMSLMADSTQAGGMRWAWPMAMVQTKTANYTALATDNMVLANAASAPFTVTLPAVAAGQMLVVKKIDSSLNAVTVAPASGTIDGAANLVMNVQWQARTFVSDGSNWFLI